MTLGEPQPLSRRQARERAREHGEAVGDLQHAIPTVDVPALTPASLRPAAYSAAPAPLPTRRSSRQQASPEPDGSGEPAESPVPVELERAEAPLSRRELRARQAEAQSRAAVESPGPEAVEAEFVPAELIEQPERVAVPVSVAPAPVAMHTVEAVGWTPPTGHWSVDQDEEQSAAPSPHQSLDELINRGIGAGGIPTTTNALILPAIPYQGPSVTAISNTGEIMITGSFDLPRSLGSTGAHPNVFDSSELDHVLDQLDVDQVGGDSAPVSASRAVSTHSPTRGMLTPPKKQRASLPMVLVIATAVLAVSVLGLFVTGYLLGTF